MLIASSIIRVRVRAPASERRRSDQVRCAHRPLWSSLSIRPSTMRILRRARLPIAGSWVTTISVIPSAFRRSSSRPPRRRVLVEVAGRLVGQQQGRAHHDGAADGDALALAAGQLVGRWGRGRQVE